MLEGVDQKLRGWWDAWRGSGHVTPLHKSFTQAVQKWIRGN